MKRAGLCFLLLAALAATASSVAADQVTLKNGDRLTGAIKDSDGKDITLKTEFMGEIKISWAGVKEISTDKPLYVVTPAKATVAGNVTSDGTNLTVHTANGGDVLVPLAQITIIRSVDEQEAYEKSLHPSLIEGWKGGVNLGFALARGNSETTNLSTGFAADRKTLRDEIVVSESSLYTTNDLPGGGVTANSILGGIRYDRNFDGRLFGFVSGDYTHDELQFLNLRQIYSFGIGLHAINTPNTTLDLLGGLNYTRESYSATATPPIVPAVTRNLLGVTLGEAFMHKFGAATVVTENYYFYPDLTNTGQYRFSLDAGSVTKLNKWLGLQLTISDRYVSNPPVLGTKANDVIFSTGINIAFLH
ncbi:MAG: DUF481 domain-containing protein [Candidatus Acidiferrales bacterium]